VPGAEARIGFLAPFLSLSEKELRPFFRLKDTDAVCYRTGPANARSRGMAPGVEDRWPSCWPRGTIRLELGATSHRCQAPG
jgi:hypothetical protein